MSFHGCTFHVIGFKVSFFFSFHRAELVGAQLVLRQIGEEVSHNWRRWRRATLAAKIMIQSTSLTENGGTGHRSYLYFWTAVWKAIGYIIIGGCGDSTVFPKPIFAILSQTFALVGKLFTGFNDAMASQKWQISGMVISLFLFFFNNPDGLYEIGPQSTSSNQFPNASTMLCVCGIMYWRLACGQREFHCWEALTWKGRGASHDWGHVSHFLCINIAPRRFLFYKIGICAHLQICSKWCHKGWLAIAKLKPLSLFISLLSMPKKAFDNVKIEKWKVKVVSALQ